MASSGAGAVTEKGKSRGEMPSMAQSPPSWRPFTRTDVCPLSRVCLSRPLKTEKEA